MLELFVSFPKIVFAKSTESIGFALSNCQFSVQLKIVLRIQVPTSRHINNVSLGRCLSKSRLLASDNTLDPGIQARDHAAELVWSSLEEFSFHIVRVFFPSFAFFA